MRGGGGRGEEYRRDCSISAKKSVEQIVSLNINMSESQIFPKNNVWVKKEEAAEKPNMIHKAKTSQLLIVQQVLCLCDCSELP